MNPKVSIIILNWNGWRDTIECLESLYQITYPNYNVILVDNGSKDESIEKIKEYCRGKIKVESKFFEYSDENKPIKIIEYTREEAEKGGGMENEIENLSSNNKLIMIKNEKNYGFAKGSNIGIRYAFKALGPSYILLLNNDTVVDARFLEELVNVAKDNKEIGMVATKLLFYDAPNIINSIGTLIFKDGSAAHLGGKDIDIGQYNQVVKTFVPCASAALYRSNMLNEIDLFDEDFFAYLEDVDLGWRARLAGWRCFLSPKSIVYHKHSASSKKYSKFKLFQIERNRTLLLIKNYPMRYLLLFPIFTFYRYYKMFLTRKNEKTEVSKYFKNIGICRIFWVLLNVWLNSFYLFPKFILKRKKVQKNKKVSNQDIEQWFVSFSEKFSKIIRR